jgi:hypothetical protein
MGLLKRKYAAVELASGDVFTDIRIITADTVRYEETAQKHRWPQIVVKDGSGTVPHLQHQERFEVWAALKRLGKYDGTWEEFKDRDLLDYSVDEVEVDPTRPAPESD